jgi:hypothetical protein
MKTLMTMTLSNSTGFIERQKLTSQGVEFSEPEGSAGAKAVVETYNY